MLFIMVVVQVIGLFARSTWGPFIKRGLVERRDYNVHFIMFNVMKRVKFRSISPWLALATNLFVLLDFFNAKYAVF